MLGRRALVASLALLPFAGWANDLWAALRRGGLVLLMRHARTTPGSGDPPGFRPDDCSTQRNLNEVGRAQARAWGEALRRESVVVDRVLSSRWCRCRETAELLGAGGVELFQPLDSLVGARENAAASRAGIRELVTSWRGPGNAVLVTHGVNITAAYGAVVAMGEALVLEPGPDGGEVLGRLPAPG
jgi:broad specificity phosphatase PhoE